MNIMHRIENGFAAAAGVTPDSWYAAILIIPDRNADFPAQDDEIDYDTAVAISQRWYAATANTPRTLELLTADGCREVLAAAARIDGPACPKEETTQPVVAWIQRVADTWELVCHSERRHIVHRSSRMLRSPSVAVHDNAVYIACDSDAGSQVFELNGRSVAAVSGRNPRIATTGDQIFVLTECAERNAIKLQLTELRSGVTHLLAADDYNFHADLIASDGTVYVAAETCPALGEDDRLGMHRDIQVWQLTGNELSGEKLPIERRAFNYWSTENMSPIHPRIHELDGTITVSYRQFRSVAHKSFGWDVFVTELADDSWSAPKRITENRSLPDTSYDLVKSSGRLIAAIPALENAAGPAICTDHRVEIGTIDQFMDAVPQEDGHADSFWISRGMKDLGPEPPMLDFGMEGRTLVWGDLHQHSCYSKCVAASDGCPDSNLRFSRDALGCKVFALTLHCQIASEAEVAWVMDTLERTAGDDGVPLYAAEPGAHPGRHTNFYTADRAIWEQLRILFQVHNRDRQRVYRHIREHMPPGSVYALRHVHGHMMPDEEIIQSFDPQLEVAMESMQGRANALMESEPESPVFGNLPMFPVQFLDRGCKVGLVGGTDHFRAKGPNRFCLTGFWVKELSPAGVFEALRNRYTIAMSNARVSLAATLNGLPFGESCTVSREDGIRIRVAAATHHGILRAGLIRDGELLGWKDIGANAASFDLVDPDPQPGSHWYVPTVEVATAYGDERNGLAHASPFFVIVEE